MVIGRQSLVRFAVFVVLVALIIVYIQVYHRDFLDRYFKESWDWGTTERVTATVTPESEEAPPPAEGTDFFVDFRLERERVRSQQVEYLRELMENQKVDEVTRQQAATRWLAIADNMGKEVDAENLIRAKGFADALVILKDDSATVIVRARELTAVEVARIADIVIRGCGVPGENISIQVKPE
ncbi:MAG: SpoIIIAH-like family protein [bacterium]|nr:SpoIIIAH-like family protein [bacterium]